MFEYRKATWDDFERIVAVASSAFKEYQFVKVLKDLLRKPERYDAFVVQLMRVMVKIFLRHELALVAEKDGQIVAIALLQQGVLPFRYYLFNEGLRLLKFISLKNILSYLNFLESSDKELHDNASFDWYLMMLAVAPDSQRQGIGSRFMTDGIEPYLRSIGGKTLAFYTNTYHNTIFYSGNGYQEVYSSEIHFNGTSMGSWYFLKELEDQ